jgi:hypothetical protein
MYFLKAVERIVAAGFLCLLIFACGEKRQDSPTIARVNTATLTLAEVKERIPLDSDLELSPIQIEQMVNRWIEMELIYQEACRRGMNKLPDVKKRIQELTREYLVSYFIDTYIDQDLTITENDIETFYEEHSDEFVRPDDRYNLQVLVAPTYNQANTLRMRLTNGEEFAVVSRDTSLTQDSEQWGELGWITLNQMPEFFERLVPNLALNVPSRPQRTDIGYFIIVVKNSRKEGEVQLLEEVRDEIVWRLKSEKGENKYRRIVAMLRENAYMERNIDRIKLGTEEETSSDGDFVF